MSCSCSQDGPRIASPSKLRTTLHESISNSKLYRDLSPTRVFASTSQSENRTSLPDLVRDVLLPCNFCLATSLHCVISCVCAACLHGCHLLPCLCPSASMCSSRRTTCQPCARRTPVQRKHLRQTRMAGRPSCSAGKFACKPRSAHKSLGYFVLESPGAWVYEDGQQLGAKNSAWAWIAFSRKQNWAPCMFAYIICIPVYHLHISSSSILHHERETINRFIPSVPHRHKHQVGDLLCLQLHPPAPCPCMLQTKTYYKS